ncbi:MULTISPECIES: TetR/AcrR family transcriptional regulator [Catenuloplanes]|uniref:AcrR family transcriptional regulator n=1 Tax=Catenuloplanes niger TaxID=587534 RepID=A0AAE3ZHB7_9ACTN|nr:helix-turn-helix domain-containing protein [Catenuloplanes niger]MDR7319969.1 AcrR family transcriptional regulator [Catenuloplanes niger]
MSDAPPRRRLSKVDRHAQLLDVARELIRDAGTDELTLGRLAERAGVTKPLVYDHFGDRAGLLAELYRAFDARQRETLEAAIERVERTLPAVAGVVAAAYIDCCVAEGQEMADVVAALAGSSTLSRVRQEAEEAYVAMCRAALEPLAGPLDAAGLHAFVGAADALARTVLAGRIGAARARAVLTRVLIAIALDPTEVTS